MASSPVRYAAFMRAINVGKRRVKMEALRGHVEDLGFGDPKTLIASGNVAFTDPQGRGEAEVARIFDAGLSELLGFDVVSAVRTGAEIERVIAARPFGEPEDTAGDWHPDDIVHVSFLLTTPDGEAANRLGDLNSDIDRFALIGREVYWRRRGKLTDSPVEPKALARAIGVDATARKVDTVIKMAGLMG